MNVLLPTVSQLCGGSAAGTGKDEDEYANGAVAEKSNSNASGNISAPNICELKNVAENATENVTENVRVLACGVLKV